MKILLFILIIISLFGCGTSTDKLSDSRKTEINILDTIKKENLSHLDWTFVKVDSSKLVFKSGRSYETKLYELEYIGQIPVVNKAPYLIFSGRDCAECDANISIYIHSPSDGELSVGHGQNSYGYPGREFYYEDNSLIYEGRAFYGQVLQNTKGVIWYQKNLIENKKWKNSIFLVDVTRKTKIDTFLNAKCQLKQTLSLFQKGLCKEIKGREYTSEP